MRTIHEMPRGRLARARLRLACWVLGIAPGALLNSLDGYEAGRVRGQEEAIGALATMLGNTHD